MATGMTRTIHPIRNLLLLSMLWAIPAGCSSPEAGSFQSIRPGMTADEVRQHLGKPSSEMTPVPGSEISWARRWHYGDTLSTLATNTLMPDQPPHWRVWTVWFDQDDRVIDVQSPSSARAPSWRPPPVPPR